MDVVAVLILQLLTVEPLTTGGTLLLKDIESYGLGLFQLIGHENPARTCSDHCHFLLVFHYNYSQPQISIILSSKSTVSVP